MNTMEIATGHDSRRPLVVKLGGSLYSHVPELVPALLASPRPLLIIPGGGPFANAVRRAQLDDETAHWEAIAAMEHYGKHVASFGLSVTEQLVLPHRTNIFLPLRCLKERDPLPHSWNVTSDTIAAWVAAELRSDLLLLKSVDGISATGFLKLHVSAPMETDVVDPLFIPFVLEKNVNTFILNGTYPQHLAQYLDGLSVPGTRISTTF
jgi:aspartokinase-like uncharacterized kinase